MATTEAFMSWGRWVADCPNPDCTNAMELELGQTDFHCWIPSGRGVCGATGDVVWPDDPEAVQTAVGGQPERDRSWMPGDELP